MAEPPSLALHLRELFSVGELARFIVSDTTSGLPRGDGHPVIVYPGMLGSDTTTYLLRSRLSEIGYEVHGWELGQNLGPRRDTLSEIRSQLVRITSEAGRKASLFGWSLGGLFAREIAKRRPDCVRQVITAGTPCSNFRATNAWKTYERLNDHAVDEIPFDTDLSELPPVPVTAIYSREDGIVAYDCMDIGQGPRHESVQVSSTHIGLVWSAEVLAVTADRLAQPEGEWAPYVRPGTRADASHTARTEGEDPPQENSRS
ncbi:hypothetical protein B5C34_01545 [Pacificimonas flava]|uniref:AB hydrolase-1 domain-containing protein n=2 Tax=Pacificimonas TaxID=1960290 RepID=A0A219B1M6_9SPHN|nr:MULTISPECIES: alpha/beta hydrolase [Pacificimonas]MBZ6378099.1 alpha/beta hydrolase [Pacificimonas aurantium]OWV32262.1 hypothetical protein B5C34_01545 [Pacificimonas flava]